MTLVVSVQAIFLSTFVMIGQNRQSAFQQAKANHDLSVAEQEVRDDTEITGWCINSLEIHEHLLGTGHVKQSEAPGKPEQAPPES